MALAAERQAASGFAPLTTLARLDRARRAGKAAAAAAALAAALRDAPDVDDIELSPEGDGVRLRGAEEGPTREAVAAALTRAVVLTGFEPAALDARAAAMALLAPVAPPESVVALTEGDAARRLPPGSAVGGFCGDGEEEEAIAHAYTCAVAVLADETAAAAAVAALDRAGGWRTRGTVRVRRAFVPKAYRKGALPKAKSGDVGDDGGEAACEPADGGAGAGDATAPPSRAKAKRRTKKDYAAWAGATSASRQEAVAALAGDGDGDGECGGGGAPPPPPPPRSGPRQPEPGERGFGVGRGRPL